MVRAFGGLGGPISTDKPSPKIFFFFFLGCLNFLNQVPQVPQDEQGLITPSQ